jgi:peptidoglycan/LPS O-acetylase OafA/YrhL
VDRYNDKEDVEKVSMGLLRFILAITVVTAHSSPVFQLTFVGATKAVQCFYVISGFYISLILNEKYVGVNDSYWLFITNRFLRLFPIYWVVLALSVILSIYLYYSSSGKILTQIGWYSAYAEDINLLSYFYLIFTNVFLFFQDAILFLGLDTSTGNLFYTSDYVSTDPKLYEFLFVPQAWTIGVELAFYLVAPFILKRDIRIVGLLILSSILLRFILYRQGLNYDPWTYRFFPTELAFFLLGNVSYRIYVFVKKRDVPQIVHHLVIIVIVTFTVIYDKFWVPGKFQLYFTLLILSIPFVFIATKRCKLDNYIGELSYPIYISHILIMNAVAAMGFWVKGAVVSITTVFFSILLNEIISKRVERTRQNRLKLKRIES